MNFFYLMLILVELMKVLINMSLTLSMAITLPSWINCVIAEEMSTLNMFFVVIEHRGLT